MRYSTICIPSMKCNAKLSKLKKDFWKKKSCPNMTESQLTGTTHQIIKRLIPRRSSQHWTGVRAIIKEPVTVRTVHIRTDVCRFPCRCIIPTSGDGPNTPVVHDSVHTPWRLITTTSTIDHIIITVAFILIIVIMMIIINFFVATCAISSTM